MFYMCLKNSEYLGYDTLRYEGVLWGMSGVLWDICMVLWDISMVLWETLGVLFGMGAFKNRAIKSGTPGDPPLPLRDTR